MKVTPGQGMGCFTGLTPFPMTSKHIKKENVCQINQESLWVHDMKLSTQL